MRILSIIAVIAATATPALAEIVDERGLAKSRVSAEVGKAVAINTDVASTEKSSQAFLDREHR